MGGNELERVKEVFASNWIAPLGPMVDKFENILSEYVGMEGCAALSSGTAAIHLALILLGVEQGDEVIVQSFTFCGSVNPVLYLKAKPILVDSDPNTWNMDPMLLRETILDRIKVTGKKPKAVIPVHLYGMPAQIEKIVDICKEFEIPVIEDAAEALGSTFNGRKLGSFGEIGILSFNGNKIITTSGGGALLSNKIDWVVRARFLSTQARDRAVHYEHSELGYNYRLSNVLAGLGVGQMEILDELIKKRRDNFLFYKALFSGSTIDVHEEPDDSLYSNHWLSTITFKETTDRFNKEELMDVLSKENIESRPLWKPMHLQPLYQKSKVYGGKISESLFEKGLCLPSGSNLSSTDKERIAMVITNFLKRDQ